MLFFRCFALQDGVEVEAQIPGDDRLGTGPTVEHDDRPDGLIICHWSAVLGDRGRMVILGFNYEKHVY